MRLKLVQVGEELLRQPARVVSREELRSEDFLQLVVHMQETLRDAPGVGLAAPQVGVPIQLAIVEDLPEYTRNLAPAHLAERERRPVPFHVIINPKITDHGDMQVEFFEGCLSVAGFTALVPRAREIVVHCLDENGLEKVIEASGWYARILQHEIDHLKGTLYLDRMYPRTFMTLENFTRRWKETPIDEVKQLLLQSGSPG